jgi:undecaprenyl-diphosphatase
MVRSFHIARNRVFNAVDPAIVGAMDRLQALDTALFRFINQGLSNSVFDWLMPILSRNTFFFPIVLVASIWLIWKDRIRGGLCVLMLLLIVGPGDKLITDTIRDTINRPRPFIVMPEARQRVVQRGKMGMPSSHAANWGAAAAILFIYYRRSLWITLPLATAVCFSRVYNGVHYPSDVLAGAILGASYGAAGVWIFNVLWQWAGPRWFPDRHKQLPSLLVPQVASKA